MQLKEVLETLKKAGTARSRKVYQRHGSGSNVYGVCFSDLRVLQKRIQVDHALALGLWKTGNADARALATLVADPSRMDAKTADQWLKDIRYYLLADLLAVLVAKAEFSQSAMKRWMASKEEYTRQCGYGLLCVLLRDGAEVADTTCERALKTIEKEIHASPNRARHAMNMAIAAIGIYRPALRAKAIRTARAVGRVDVDHGETGCKTPDAEDYIRKAAARARR